MGARAPDNGTGTSQDGMASRADRDTRGGGAHWQAWLAEFAATAVLLFVMATLFRWLAGPGSPLAEAVPSQGGRLVVDAVVSGATVGLLILSPLGRRSGAHMNTAVSVAFWLMGALPGRDLAPYAVAQLAGSVTGVAAGRLLWGGALAGPGPDFAAVRAAQGVPVPLVFLSEAVATALLLAAVTHVAARPGPAPRVPLVAGAAVTVLILLTGGWAGGSFNPARQFGPGLLAGDTGWLWVYAPAPLIAAVLFAAVRSALPGAPPPPRMEFGQAPR
ncbi:MIP/aquaporin family protein [Actinacidiphila sp. bgisy160]|uniref:MIP/aquaporin family protein n=1 Tax=Actinacidiphila sp. bgisy160 TaxID=3413796 RepID=UPI003D75AD20